MSCGHEQANELARSSGKNASYITIPSFFILVPRGRTYFGQLQESPPLASGAALLLDSTKNGHLWRQRPRFFWSAPRMATSGAGGRTSIGQHQEWPFLAIEAALLLVSTKNRCLWRQKPRFFWSALRIATAGARGRDSWYWPKGARPRGTRA